MALVLIGLGCGGCSLSRSDSSFAKMGDDMTGSVGPAAVPTESDLAFARNAASDVLTRGDKDASQPWENPETGARGSVTPLAQAYSSEGRTCRDFLASYVKGNSESWLQGAACQIGRGQWKIHTLKPWRQSRADTVSRRATRCKNATKTPNENLAGILPSFSLSNGSP